MVGASEATEPSGRGRQGVVVVGVASASRGIAQAGNAAARSCALGPPLLKRTAERTLALSRHRFTRYEGDTQRPLRRGSIGRWQELEGSERLGLAAVVKTGAAPAPGSGTCLNKIGRLKSSGEHSLTGLHQHTAHRETDWVNEGEWR